MKHIFIIMLVFVICCTSCVIVSAKYDAIGYNEYETASELINVTNIMTLPKSKTDKITRAEAVNAVVRCVVPNSGNKDASLSEGVFASENPYRDVDKNEWYAYNAEVAKKAGIISENADGFNPGDYIRINEVQKMIICALRYDKHAKANGGYPSGYNIMANRIGISDGVYSDDTNGFISAQDFIIMLYNTLTTKNISLDILEKLDDGKWTATYKKDKITLLNYAYDIYDQEGIVYATERSALDSTLSADPGSVILKTDNGKSQYYINDNKAFNYIGRRVKIYYKNIGPRKNALTVCPIYDDTVSIDADDGIFYNVSDNTLEYTEKIVLNLWDTKKQDKKIKVAPTVDWIINGCFCNEPSEAINIINGKSILNLDRVFCIDSDNDGKTDVISIKAFYNVYMDTYSVTLKTIRDKYTKVSFELEPKDGHVIYNITDKNGTSLSLSDINAGKAISVYEGIGNDERYLDIVVSSSVITGELREKQVLNNEVILLCGDEKYKVSNNVLGFSDKLEPGTGYKFYIDLKGRIAGFKQDTSVETMQYGFVIGSYVSAGLDKKLNIKLYNVYTGEFSQHLCTQNFKFNDDKGSLDLSNVINSVNRRLVSFSLNSENEINEIKTAVVSPDENTLSYSLGQPEGNALKKELTYKDGTRVFFGTSSVSIDDDTKIIKVPDDDYNGDMEKAISQGTYKSCFDNDKTYIVEGYNTGEAKVTSDILLFYGASGKDIAPDAPFFVVGSVKHTINSSETEATSLTGVYSEAEKTVLSADKTFVDINGNPITVKPGDIVQLHLNAADECDALKVVYSPEDPDKYLTPDTPYYGVSRVIKGSVYLSDSRSAIIVKNTFDYDESLLANSSNVEMQSLWYAKKYMVEMAGNSHEETTAKLAKSSDFLGAFYDPVKYSRVIWLSSYGNPGTIVIYK